MHFSVSNNKLASELFATFNQTVNFSKLILHLDAKTKYAPNFQRATPISSINQYWTSVEDLGFVNGKLDWGQD